MAPVGAYVYHNVADSLLRNNPNNFDEEYNNTFLEGYYDALLENYDVLNEAEKSKLKKFLKKHKKKLIAGAALLGTAGAVAGGTIVHNNKKNYEAGVKELKSNYFTDNEIKHLDKKNIKNFGKQLRKMDKHPTNSEKYGNKANDEYETLVNKSLELNKQGIF